MEDEPTSAYAAVDANGAAEDGGVVGQVWGGISYGVSTAADYASSTVSGAWDYMAGSVAAPEVHTDVTARVGSNFEDGVGKPVPSSVLSGAYVGIYVGANWAAPCAEYLDALAQAYHAIRAAGHRFEVVYASADTTKDEYAAEVGKMPWMAIPFDDVDTRKAIMSYVNASVVPRFVLVDPEGKLLTQDSNWPLRDTSGAYFPWKGSSSSCVIC